MSVPEMMLSSNLVVLRRRALTSTAMPAMIARTPAPMAQPGMLPSRSSKKPGASRVGALAGDFVGDLPLSVVVVFAASLVAVLSVEVVAAGGVVAADGVATNGGGVGGSAAVGGSLVVAGAGAGSAAFGGSLFGAVLAGGVAAGAVAA